MLGWASILARGIGFVCENPFRRDPPGLNIRQIMILQETYKGQARVNFLNIAPQCIACIFHTESETTEFAINLSSFSFLDLYLVHLVPLLTRFLILTSLFASQSRSSPFNRTWDLDNIIWKFLWVKLQKHLVFLLCEEIIILLLFYQEKTL